MSSTAPSNPSEDKLRLFAAVAVPEEQLSWLEGETAGLRSRWPQARWTDIRKQHVTLKFLGPTRRALLPEISDALARAAARRQAGPVAISGLGVFPSPRRARVLWAGLHDPRGLLTALADDLDALLEPLGYHKEARAFTPHLTLARFKVPENLSGDLVLASGRSGEFHVSGLGLWRSRLHPTGARYEIIEDFPFE